MLNWRISFCGIFQKWSFLKIFIPSGKYKCPPFVSPFKTKEFYVAYIKSRTTDHEISEFSSFFIFIQNIFFIECILIMVSTSSSPPRPSPTPHPSNFRLSFSLFQKQTHEKQNKIKTKQKNKQKGKAL